MFLGFFIFHVPIVLFPGGIDRKLGLDGIQGFIPIYDDFNIWFYSRIRVTVRFPLPPLKSDEFVDRDLWAEIFITKNR